MKIGYITNSHYIFNYVPFYIGKTYDLICPSPPIHYYTLIDSALDCVHKNSNSNVYEIQILDSGHKNEFTHKFKIIKQLSLDECILSSSRYKLINNKLCMIHSTCGCSYQYDINGNCIKANLLNNTIYISKYDECQNKVYHGNLDGTEWMEYYYNSSNQKIKTVYSDGQWTKYKYDSDNNLVLSLYSTGNYERYDYENNKLVRYIDTHDNEWEWNEYNYKNLIIHHVCSDGFFIDTKYNDNGLIHSEHSVSFSSVYFYDSNYKLIKYIDTNLMRKWIYDNDVLIEYISPSIDNIKIY